MQKNKIFIIAGIILIGLALIWVSTPAFRNIFKQALPAQSPQSSGGIENLGSPSGETLDELTPEEVERLVNNGSIPTSVPYDQFTKPATCQVSGTIKFLSPTISEDLKARIVYSGIDSPARQIKWKVSPQDDLRVGPNLVASLKVPDGESMVGAVLPENPKSKSYTLTASMTYGRLVGEGIKVYEMTCSGKVSVILAY